MKMKLVIALLYLTGYTSAMQKTFDSNHTLNDNSTIKKSRKKMEAIFQPTVRLGPNAHEATPTVLFHGVKQRCSEFMI